MRHPYSPSFDLLRLLGNIAVLLMIGWCVFRVGNWLGWTSPPGCYLGQGLAELLGSTLLETAATLCVLAWMLTMGRKVEALILALILMELISFLDGKMPALLATC